MTGSLPVLSRRLNNSMRPPGNKKGGFMRKYIVFVVLALVLAAFLGACGTSQVEDQKPTETITPANLKIGHVNQDHHLALYVAALKGEEFKDKGIFLKMIKDKEIYELYSNDALVANVAFVKTKGGAEMVTNLLAGAFDLGFGGIPAVMGAVDKGKGVKILMPLQSEGAQLVVDKEMGVKSWDEFVGYASVVEPQMKVGYKAPTAVQSIILKKALKEVGITFTEDPKDTTAKILLVDMKGEQNFVPGLANDQIDAFVSSQPAPAQAQVAGEGFMIAELSTLPPEGMWTENPCCMICAPTDFYPKNSVAVKEFLKLMVIATDWINENKPEAIKIAQAFLGTKDGVEELLLPGIKYSYKPTEAWKNGVVTWSIVSNELGQFKGSLKDVADMKAVEMCVDFSLLDEAKES